MATHCAEWIFVSYRRVDTAAEAEALANHLRQRFSSGAVFFDKDRIEYGQDFNKVLAQRVRAARVVLVMIGAKWLAELTARAKLPDPDYVRLEVAEALLPPDGDRVVIPVICGNGAMPGAHALQQAGFNELSALATKHGPNAFSLDRLTLADQLAAHIDSVAARLPDGDLSHASAVQKFRAEAAIILKRSGAAPLAQLWQQWQVDDKLNTSTRAAIVAFGLGLEEWNSDRAGAAQRLDLDAAASLRACCRDLLGGLLGCAADRVQAVALVQAGMPVPTLSPGLSGVTHSLGHGRKPVVASNPLSEDFGLTRHLVVAASGGPDPGSLADLTEAVAVQLHNMAQGEIQQHLTPGQRKDLPTLLSDKAGGRDGPFVLVAQAPTDTRHQELRALGTAFQIPTQAYTGDEDPKHSLFYDDQRALRVAVNTCQRHIERIQ